MAEFAEARRRRARRSIAKTRDNMVLSEPRRSECIDCTRAVKDDLEKRRARGKRYYAEHREECCAAQRAYDRLRPSAKGNSDLLISGGADWRGQRAELSDMSLRSTEKARVVRALRAESEGF
jgi:hypothetical protein